MSHPTAARRLITLLALPLLLITSHARAADPEISPRQRTSVNAFWKYQQGDFPGAQAPAFNDAPWQSFGLPHSFSIPYFLSQDFYIGYGWYRKHLQLPDNLGTKCYNLDFDGVFQEAEVFVNGKSVGTHKGGYTGFQVDFTAAAQPGDNLIAIRVNNNWNARLAPRSGEHVFSGGIYRDVNLVVTDPLHVAWCGTFITTPDATSANATVKITTEFVNDSTTGKNATIRQQILDPDGHSVADFSDARPIAGLTTRTLDMTSPPIKSPNLWHPDHPFLYTLKTTVLDGPRVVDEYSTPFGIRTIKWTADQGFFLNGEHLYLRGANAHQDQAGWGDAVTDAAAYRDVKLVKDAGFNFIRGSHYPHSPAFVDACDKLGVMFWCENDFWSTAQGRSPEGYFNGSGYPTRAEDQPEFEASSKQQLTEMVRIHRNHPAIVAWSMCNEPFFVTGSVMNKTRAFLKDLVTLTHTLDPSRPAALGGVQRPTDNNGRIDRIGDIAGYNGDGASIAAFQNPGIPNIVSEYNHPSSDRPGPYDAGWADLPRTAGANRNNPDSWRPAWRSGEVIWCAFDYGTIAGPSLGKMGIVDYFRIPKRSWYWYRNDILKIAPPEWSQPGTPAGLKLTADKTDGIRTDGTDDAWLEVSILDAAGKPINNAPPVEFTIIKGPGEFPTGTSIAFDPKSDIRILDGLAAIAFRSYYAGDTVIRATSPGLTPSEITLHFTGTTPWQEGKTPAVAPRPYVRYVRNAAPAQAQSFGHNNPTFPTSAAEGHSGAMANDGDAKTYWQPAAGDADPAFILDMERSVNIARVRLTFPQALTYQLTIESSDDQKTWRPIADLNSNHISAATLDQPAPAGASGRFIRVHFATTPQLAEIEVVGTMKSQ